MIRNMKERDKLKDLGIKGRVILNCIRKKLFRIGLRGWLL